MPTLQQLYLYLDKLIPKSLSCEWDNDGMMVCPDKYASVRKVLLSLDVTSKAIEYAVDEGFDTIVSHHPLIFRPLKGIGGDDPISSKIVTLVKNGINVLSFHTRLDALDGGVNDHLAELLGLEDVEVIPGDPCMIGRIGIVDYPCDLGEFAQNVKEELGARYVNIVDAQLDVSRVALCGGDGKDLLKAAFEAGADTYVTGTLSYNNMVDAAEFPMNVVEAGHFHTEDHVLHMLADMIEEFDPDIEIEIYESDPVRTI